MGSHPCIEEAVELWTCTHLLKKNMVRKEASFRDNSEEGRAENELKKEIFFKKKSIDQTVT